MYLRSTWLEMLTLDYKENTTKKEHVPWNLSSSCLLCFEPDWWMMTFLWLGLWCIFCQSKRPNWKTCDYSHSGGQQEAPSLAAADRLVSYRGWIVSYLDTLGNCCIWIVSRYKFGIIYRIVSRSTNSVSKCTTGYKPALKWKKTKSANFTKQLQVSKFDVLFKKNPQSGG